MKHKIAYVFGAIALAFIFFDSAHAQEKPAATAPAEAAHIDGTADGAAKIAQYEKAIAVILKQRSEADAMARDWQLQAALAAGELAAAKEANEALKKQLADLSAKASATAGAQAKLADLAKPKPAPTETKVAAKE